MKLSLDFSVGIFESHVDIRNAFQSSVASENILTNSGKIKILKYHIENTPYPKTLYLEKINIIIF